MSIKVHIAKYGMVHALWLISILVLIIAFLLLNLPDGAMIGDYIAFAASIASLVLAVVAIFYSIIFNQGFSETVGVLKGSADDVKLAASQICDVSTQLNGQSDRLLGEFSQLSPAVLAISDKLDRSLQPSAEIGDVSSPSEPGNKEEEFLSKFVSGGSAIAIYALALSSLTKIRMTPFKMFPSDLAWQNYISGFLTSSSLLADMTIRREDQGADETFIVESLGSLTPGTIIEWFNSRSGRISHNMKPVVDKYFGFGEERRSGEADQAETEADTSVDGE